jgi:alkylhydroperoxidase family enzyme
MDPSTSDQLSELLAATRRAVLDGPGFTDASVRRQAAAGNPPSELAPLVKKIRERAYTVTDEDVDRLRARYSEDELFELIVAAAVGAAGERASAALNAVERA